MNKKELVYLYVTSFNKTLVSL